MLDQDPSAADWAGQRKTSAGAVRIAPPAQARPLPEPAAEMLRGGIGLVVLAVLIFVVLGIGTSMIAGTPFTVPHSGNIPGLHTNYWVPPIVAAVGYLLLQMVAKWIGASGRTWREVVKFAATDYLLLALFILIIYVHFNIKMWLPLLNPRIYDADYFAVDQALQPLLTVFQDIRGAIAHVLPWTDIWYQAAFMVIFVLSFLSHALGSRRFHLHNMFGVMLIEMVGVFTYMIAPAVGPFIYEQGANALATTAELKMLEVYQNVRDGGVAWIAANGGMFFAEPPAAMPSLHVGCSLIITYYAFRGRLWMAPISAVALTWIFIESVVSRWHYLVDLPVGILLAIAVIAVTNRLLGDGSVADAKERRSLEGAESGTLVPLRAAGSEMAVGQPVAGQPLVWVLQCHRPGDHAQSLALANALGWPYVVKKTVFHWYELFFALAGMATLVGLNKRHSSPFAGPPWPDLVILAGRQNETPAKWIRKKSGGRSKIVVIGRPWTPQPQLDCLITTPQFRLPKHGVQLLNRFPLHLATKERLSAEAAAWAPRIGNLPRPWIALMVGGSSGPYVFSRESARRLGREASDFARAQGGTLLVSTSARTTKGAMRALEAAIDVPCQFYRFRENDPDNPHLGYLALADEIIVTGDSLSMLTEACATDRQVYIFEFGGGLAAMHSPRVQRDPRIRQWWRWSQLKDQGLLGLHYAIAIHLPPFKLNRSRDLRLIQDQVIASGRAHWLGDSSGTTVRALPSDDLQRAVERVRSLVQPGKGAGTRSAAATPIVQGPTGASTTGSPAVGATGAGQPA